MIAARVRELLEAWGLDERSEAWRFCAGLSDRLPAEPPRATSEGEIDDMAREIRELEERVRASDTAYGEGRDAGLSAAADSVEEAAREIGLPALVVSLLGRAAEGPRKLEAHERERLRLALQAWAYPAGTNFGRGDLD